MKMENKGVDLNRLIPFDLVKTDGKSRAQRWLGNGRGADGGTGHAGWRVEDHRRNGRKTMGPCLAGDSPCSPLKEEEEKDGHRKRHRGSKSRELRISPEKVKERVKAVVQ
jgi:hypothetical protein